MKSIPIKLISNFLLNAKRKRLVIDEQSDAALLIAFQTRFVHRAKQSDLSVAQKALRTTDLYSRTNQI